MNTVFQSSAPQPRVSQTRAEYAAEDDSSGGQWNINTGGSERLITGGEEEEEEEASLSLDHMNVKINRSTCGAAVWTVYTGLHSQPLLECTDTLCVSTL